MSDLVGTVISHKYELTKFLGEGGLGRVFLAEQKPMGRQVALKLLHPELSGDASLAARFEREALAASRISHPNSVVIHDFGSDLVGSRKQLYLVMEFLKGETLHERIQGHPKRRLPAWEAVHILTQVLRPLAAFHKAGVVHRDLKPDNIMLCLGDWGEQVKLLDFGIAKVSGSSLTATGQMVGTPHYMAPEQITASKELGLAVDIYAMGVLLYEALTGDPPYMAEHHIDLFRMHLMETPKALAERFPEEPYLKPFDAVIRKAMSKKPGDRYQSADEFVKASITGNFEQIACLEKPVLGKGGGGLVGGAVIAFEKGRPLNLQFAGNAIFGDDLSPLRRDQPGFDIRGPARSVRRREQWRTRKIAGAFFGIGHIVGACDECHTLVRSEQVDHHDAEACLKSLDHGRRQRCRARADRPKARKIDPGKQGLVLQQHVEYGRGRNGEMRALGRNLGQEYLGVEWVVQHHRARPFEPAHGYAADAGHIDQRERVEHDIAVTQLRRFIGAGRDGHPMIMAARHPLGHAGRP